jgi:phage host-nuclease inhibitor protein Gam
MQESLIESLRRPPPEPPSIEETVSDQSSQIASLQDEVTRLQQEVDSLESNPSGETTGGGTSGSSQGEAQAHVQAQWQAQAARAAELQRARAEAEQLRIARIAELVRARNDPAVQAALHEAQAQKAYAGIAAMLETDRGARAALEEPGALPPAAAAELVAGMPMSGKARILDTLQLVKSLHGETEAGRQAAELLSRLEDNTDLSESVKQWRAGERPRQIFQIGLAYEKCQLYELAAGSYQQVAECYPQSGYADEARMRLGAINRQEN